MRLLLLSAVSCLAAARHETACDACCTCQGFLQEAPEAKEEGAQCCGYGPEEDGSGKFGWDANSENPMVHAKGGWFKPCIELASEYVGRRHCRSRSRCLCH